MTFARVDRGVTPPHRLILYEPFASLWQAKDPFAEVSEIEGQIYRELEGRRTLRFEVEGNAYFLKIHRGVGWREIFKNLLYLRLPVIDASNEYEAICHCQEHGIATMRPVAFGRRGRNPAKAFSFLITEALAPTEDLDRFGELHWKTMLTDMRRGLLSRVACIARELHRSGINHRDFYLCHFLLHTDNVDALKISLIDLHRAQIRKVVPDRWRNKDLAALYFSSFKFSLTRSERLRFLKSYFQLKLRDIVIQEADLLDFLQREANRLQERYDRKFAPNRQTD